MATFRRESNGYIYLYHWINPTTPLKVSTKLKIELTDWNKKKARPRDVNATYLGSNIIDEMKRYENTLGESLIKYPEDSVQVVRHELGKLLNNSSIKEYSDFLEYFKDFKEKAKQEERSNWKSYNTCYKHLCKYQNNKPLPFSAVDMRFYNSYNNYLLSLKLAANTVANQWKLIKAVMSKAFVEEYHNNATFKHFKQRMEQADTIYLSVGELSRMMNKKLSGHLEKARDYFIIGSFTGLRFEDWNRVKQSTIKDGTMSIRATKTGEVSIIPVHPYVQQILDKYEGVLPPKPSNQKMNDYIKVAAMRADINDDIEVRITRGGKKEIRTEKKHDLVTTHTARRSLATNLILEGVSPYVVMKVTGHKSLSSFERYVKLRELEAGIELKSLSFFS